MKRSIFTGLSSLNQEERIFLINMNQQVFHLEEPQVPESKVSKPQVPESQVPKSQVPEPQVLESQVPKSQVPEPSPPSL